MQTSKTFFAELKKLLPNSRCELSGVKVAAIVVTDTGIYKGVNYEDPVCSLSICAERNAIFNAITNGMKEIYEIHILSSVAKTQGLHMCGACRQVASNFMKTNGKIYLYTLDGRRKEYKFGDVFPHRNFAVNKAIMKK